MISLRFGNRFSQDVGLAFKYDVPPPRRRTTPQDITKTLREPPREAPNASGKPSGPSRRLIRDPSRTPRESFEINDFTPIWKSAEQPIRGDTFFWSAGPGTGPNPGPHQDGPGGPQAKISPGHPQDHPQNSPRPPAPGTPQDAPGGPQDATRGPQDAPKRLQNAPQKPQDHHHHPGPSQDALKNVDVVLFLIRFLDSQGFCPRRPKIAPRAPPTPEAPAQDPP